MENDRSIADRDRARKILDLLSQVVEPLAVALGEGCEVVVHDLTNLENSIYAIGGGVTGRRVGSPPTDLLLQHVLGGAKSNIIGYATKLPGGREGRSSTIIVRDPVDDSAVAALCLNIDVTNVRQAHRLLGSLLGGDPESMVLPVPETPSEAFPRTVAELTTQMMKEVIDSTGIPVELMKKSHKIDVVAALNERGVFQVKEAVEDVASALDVTRFTIYNYLNELQDRSLEGIS
ncbi:transcriptional regulator [Arthrobacter sp. JSM 101049]|uniref:helix-turn-helix transcriptional regulator n=1 Tax=Arthrobacter sp. JSM 101049 TaxID=929097 RepID=UPI0035613F48